MLGTCKFRHFRRRREFAWAGFIFVIHIYPHFLVFVPNDLRFIIIRQDHLVLRGRKWYKRFPPTFLTGILALLSWCLNLLGGGAFFWFIFNSRFRCIFRTRVSFIFRKCRLGMNGYDWFLSNTLNIPSSPSHATIIAGDIICWHAGLCWFCLGWR
uniref:Uncharacterized protein n=1 Tax=Cacopsylla melanoneura TaxID=428564 RepID=A0A8D8QIS5_9HEMI